MKQCTIETEEAGDITILHLDGALDSHSYTKLEGALHDLFKAERYRVILDCMGLQYLNSTAIGALIGFARTARQAEGGNMLLTNLTPKVQGVIENLGFDKVLNLSDTIEEAQATFAQS